LSYYSLITITKGTGNFVIDGQTLPFKALDLLSAVPHQPFYITGEGFTGTVIHFHPDFFCIHKHQHEVACNGIIFNDAYGTPIYSLNGVVAGKLQHLYDQMTEELLHESLAQYELLLSYLKIYLITA